METVSNNDLAVADSETPPADVPARGGARRTALNVASMLTTNVMRKGSTFVLYALVARYLGAYQFGQFALANVLLYSWQRCAQLGLQTLITREVARDHDATARYLVHSHVVGIAASAIGFALAVGFVNLMGYSDDTARVILVMFVGLAPFVLNQMCEGVLQGWERMHLIAYASVPVSVLKVVAGFVILERGYGILALALVIAATHGAQLLLQWILIGTSLGWPRAKFQFGFAVNMVRDSFAFLGIQSLQAVRTGIIAVVLSKFSGEIAVGLYSAAAQLLIPLTLIFNNVSLSLFPVMCRSFDLGMKQLAQVARRTMEGLMLIALPAVVGLFLLADGVLLMIYGNGQFAASATVLQIIVWLPLQNAMTSVMGQTLWASKHEKLSLRISFVNTVLQAIVSVVFISQFGLMGAAASALLVGVVNLAQHYIPVARLFSGQRLFTALRRPILATAVMAAVVYWSSHLNLLLAIATGAAVYCCAVMLLFIWSAGGLHQFKGRCVQIWTS